MITVDCKRLLLVMLDEHERLQKLIPSFPPIAHETVEEYRLLAAALLSRLNINEKDN